MARTPFEYVEGCEGPDVNIDIIPANFPICEEVPFETPKRLTTCTDLEIIDFTVPPACPCFPTDMGLTDNSLAKIKCLGSTAIPYIDIKGCKLVNVAPDDCCSPELKLDLQLDIGVPCPGPVGACARITGQTDIMVKQHDAVGKANLVFRRCVDDQGNFTNDPCCMQLFGEIILPCPDIDFIVDAEVTEDPDVAIPFLEIFTITPRLQPGNDPNPPCEYDVRFKLKLPKSNVVILPPYDPEVVDNCCNGVGYCPDTKSFSDLGKMFTGVIPFVSGITCDKKGNLRVEKSKLDVVCGNIKGFSFIGNEDIPCDGAKGRPPCCPTTTTTTEPYTNPPTSTDDPTTTPPPPCECSCETYYVCDNESGLPIPDIIVRVIDTGEGCIWRLVDFNTTGDDGNSLTIYEGGSGCPTDGQEVTTGSETYVIQCYPCGELPTTTTPTPPPRESYLYKNCNSSSYVYIPYSDYPAGTPPATITYSSECYTLVGWSYVTTPLISGYTPEVCECGSSVYGNCATGILAYLPLEVTASTVTIDGECYTYVGPSASPPTVTSYAVSGCECAASRKFKRCNSEVDLFIFLPTEVIADTVIYSGYCYEYVSVELIPPSTFDYLVEECDCTPTTTTTTTTAAPDYYEYDACVEQPPTYQSVEYYQCFDFMVNGYSSVFVYVAIDEISPGVLNNPTQIVVGGMCYTINGYSTTAVDTMSYTSGPCNCDNFSDEFRRCSDDAPIFIPLYTTFAANITYGGDCYYYMGPSTTEPDSLGSFTEDDCSC